METNGQNDISTDVEPIDVAAPETNGLTLSAPSKKVAVLGTTPSRMEGPIAEDSGWEIWTIGPGGKDTHRWDRLFEIHQRWPANFGERDLENGGKSYLDDLSKVAAPQTVYSLLPMQMAMEEWAFENGKDTAWMKEHVTGDWSGNVVINRDSLFERFGRTWFSSSISYALAMAIEERFTDIAVYGIDLESGEEYVAQFPGCRYFIDLARFVGINVHLPKGCGLMREPRPYPDRYETHQALMMERKVAWLEQVLTQQKVELQETTMMTHRVEGALLKMRQMAEKPMSQEETLKEVQAGEAELIQYSQQQARANSNVNHCQGEMSALRYVQRMWVFGAVDPDFDLSAGRPA